MWCVLKHSAKTLCTISWMIKLLNSCIQYLSKDLTTSIQFCKVFKTYKHFNRAQSLTAVVKIEKKLELM